MRKVIALNNLQQQILKKFAIYMVRQTNTQIGQSRMIKSDVIQTYIYPLDVRLRRSIGVHGDVLHK